MNQFGYFLLTALSLALFEGCGSNTAHMASGSKEQVDWQVLDKLDGEKGLMAVGYPLEMGDVRSAAAHIKSPDFKAIVDELEQAELPEQLEDKTAEKEEAVAKLRKLIETAKSSPKKEQLKSAYDEASQAISALRSNDG